jgi:opacity protein-like surface antigen
VLRGGAGALLLLGVVASAARAQEGLFERLGLDRLRLTSIGVGYGPATPAKVEPTHSFALQVDYGEIARHVHVVFGASYWESSFTDEVVNEFVRQLEGSIVDPAGDDTVHAGRVRVSAVSLEMEARYYPGRPNAALKPYVSLGLGAHAINAESKLINDTFVESALDNISTGVTGVAGLDIAPARRISFGVQARYTLMSTVRFGTLRALANYHFGRPRRQGRDS